MTILADLLSTMFERRYRTLGQGRASERPVAALMADLLGSAGETSELALAQDILGHYASLDDAGKLAFLRHLAHDMNIDPETVRSALDAYEQSPSKLTYRAFMGAAEPQRQELIRRLNRVPGATGALVRMRADLLRLAGDDPELAALDLDFRHLFASWFNRGFLVLRPINWESPAHILEKIIAYEAVHAIHSWDDLRRRLLPEDRRCYAYFHPAMPEEPLIFVEVALTDGIAGNIQAVLAEDRPALPARQINTAVFYSISNCQKGLRGISFGNSLIKQVVEDLKAAMPGLTTFVTLSPVPGFRRWAETALEDLPEEESRTLRSALDDTSDDPAAARTLRAQVAHYLIAAKHPRGGPLDPVARFHLGNGALLHEVHAGADISPNGLRQSCGAMVNYLYDLNQIDRNIEGYSTSGTVAHARPLANLLKTHTLSRS